MRVFRSALALVFLAAPVALALAGGQRAAPVGAAPKAPYVMQDPDYAGTFGENKSGRALLKVIRRDRPGDPVKALFQPVRITLRCVGLEDREMRYGMFPVLFTSKRAFSGFNYGLQETGIQVVTHVDGRLSRNGRSAAGRILILDSPNTDDYCSTIGFRTWQARRVR